MTSGRPPANDDVAAALTTAVAMLGQRPAITGLLPEALREDDLSGATGGRREQGFASLAGWVAKGANLLHAELGLGAGDRLALAGPPGWPLAAVTLSAWWLGLAVVPRAPVIGAAPEGADIAILVTHAGTRRAEDHSSPSASVFHLAFGDALDGTSGRDTVLEQWTDAVTPHGDRPPVAAHDGDLVALVMTDGTEYTQRTLLTTAVEAAGSSEGVLGMLRQGDEDLLTASDAARRLAALTLRPLVTGAATVVVDATDPERDAIERAERIAHWLD